MSMTATLALTAFILAACAQCAGPEVVVVQPEGAPAPRTTPAPREFPSEPAPPPPSAPAKPAPPKPPAVPQAPASASASSSAIPTVIIDCATSAMSAKRLADLKIPTYPWFGQSPDPASLTTGRIDVGILIAEIRKRMGPNPTGWGMLDYEDPFDAWLELPITDPRNRLASSEMVRAIKAVKAEFPNVKWTYYAQPRMARQFPDRKSWPDGTDAAKKAEFERRIAVCSDILREVDWINPSIYDVYENAMFKGGERDFMLANEAIWREQVVRLSKLIRERLGLPQVPVLPALALFYQPGGRATNMKPIRPEELITDQVEPALRGGADGFAIWTSMDFFQMLATLPPEKELNELNRENQKAARDAWVPAFFAGKAPRDWTSPDVKFTISQETGRVIADGAALVDQAVKQHRAKQSPTR